MVPNDQLRQVLAESASEVLETMCFVGVLGADAAPLSVDLISAELIFNGNPSGLFGVRVPPSTGRLIAANFLGKEADDTTEAEIEQVVGELTNMICGSVLSRVEAGARFELLHPVIIPLGEDLPHPEAISSILELEEGSIVLWMVIGETVPVAPAYRAA
jgi:CheY-specific phosphatase CheX